MCSLRPAPEACSLAESEGEERGGARRRDPKSHRVGGGGFPPQWRRGCGESRIPPGESGLGELASLKGSGSVDKEEERIPGPHAVGGPCGARGRVGGTPELSIVMGVDDNPTPSSLPSVWRRTLGRKGPDSPGSPPVLRKGGIPAARKPPFCHPRLLSLQATHSCALEALRPRVLLRPRGAGRLRAAAVPGFGRNQGMQRFPPPAPSLEGGAAGQGRGWRCEPSSVREGPPRLPGGSRGSWPSREEPYKEWIR